MNEVFIADVRPLFDQRIFAGQLGRLPEDRQQKIKAIKQLKSRCLSLGAWLLLLEWMENNGFDLPQVMIGEHGKPFFCQAREIGFNLSHSGNLAACAVMTQTKKESARIGIDIELWKAREVLGIAGRYFRKEEYQELLAVSGAEARREVFYRCWTIKESYVKAVGTGLSKGLDSFLIRSKAGRVEEPEGGGLFYKTYLLPQLLPGETYTLSVCSEDPGFSGAPFIAKFT